ncbi:MAG: amidohydrolase family protein [Bryobacteraceae bacterium]
MHQNRRGFFSHAAALAAPPSGPSVTLERRLLTAIDAIECIDTHEHFYAEKVRAKQAVDIFTFASHYLFDDLVAAGMPEETKAFLTRRDVDEQERWRAFEPYWKSVRMTGYGQALRIAVRDLYGYEEISASTLRGIHEAMRKAARPGMYEEVLCKRGRIRVVLLDHGWKAAPIKPEFPFFKLARAFDRYIMVRNRKEVRELEEANNVAITDLNGLKQAVERSFAQSLEYGMVAVKTTLAYHRDLQFHPVDASAAERDVQLLLKGERETPQGRMRFLGRPFRNLEDHMFRHVVSLAGSHGIPVQIHTGTFAGHWNYVANSNPTHLTGLLLDFPKVRFDLFHMSYPYQGELAAMTKLFPHVWADFCWAHVLSPTAARRALREFLDTVPANKICGFGGDYWFPEMSYAHLVMAKRNIASVLAEMVSERVCTEDEGLETAKMLLHDNPARLFGLGFTAAP